MRTYVRPYTEIEIERTDVKFAHVLKLCKIQICSVQVDTMDPSVSNSTPMDLLDATEDSSQCNSTVLITRFADSLVPRPSRVCRLQYEIIPSELYMYCSLFPSELFRTASDERERGYFVDV